MIYSRLSSIARRTSLSVIVGIALATTLAACSTSVSSGAPAPTATSRSFGHIHGVGVDGTTGAVYIATHEGLYRVPSLRSEPLEFSALGGPVAGLHQDTMGFVINNGRMYASGHPAPEATSTEKSLGLITSADHGSTWRSLSLQGRTDFHDLEISHDAAGGVIVYGFDSGTSAVEVSRDGGATWATGATIALRDLTADPGIEGTIYATTVDGVMVSRDFGTTFSVLTDAPSLYLIDAMSGSTEGNLIGVDVSGSIWTKSTGRPWRVTGAVQGRAEAMVFSAKPQPVLVVADGGGLVVSSDLGATWKIVASLK
jgi:hypothetical protein